MSTATGAGPSNAVARIALMGVDDVSAAVLTECFLQFGIRASKVPVDESGKVAGTYSACVVPLEAASEPTLQEIRRASHRIVLYGMCGNITTALRFAKWGINAVFYTPVRKQEALQVVRSTHLLVLKELRRYVRVPLVCPVTLETGTEVVESSSIEISAGGMSLTTKAPRCSAGRITSRTCWARAAISALLSPCSAP